MRWNADWLAVRWSGGLGVLFTVIWLFGGVWIVESSGRVILMLGDDTVDNHSTKDYRKCSPEWKPRPVADGQSDQRGDRQSDKRWYGRKSEAPEFHNRSVGKVA